jgi:hypothetical protein
MCRVLWLERQSLVNKWLRAGAKKTYVHTSLYNTHTAHHHNLTLKRGVCVCVRNAYGLRPSQRDSAMDLAVGPFICTRKGMCVTGRALQPVAFTYRPTFPTQTTKLLSKKNYQACRWAVDNKMLPQSRIKKKEVGCGWIVIDEAQSLNKQIRTRIQDSGPCKKLIWNAEIPNRTITLQE